jgi:hypothetical protein
MQCCPHFLDGSAVVTAVLVWPGECSQFEGKLVVVGFRCSLQLAFAGHLFARWPASHDQTGYCAAVLVMSCGQGVRRNLFFNFGQLRRP